MKVFKGIPKKRIITDTVFSIVWSLFNASFSKMLADLVANITSANVLVRTALFFLCYIIVWEILELIADIHSTYTGGVIEANVNRMYFNELYRIKPSVLKENNTGYISGILNKLVIRQESAYRNLVLNVPICIVYILYFGYQMWLHHWTLGLMLVLIALLGNVIRFSVGKISKRYASELTDAEGSRNKLVVDFVSNINTVQKMRSIKFMNSRIDEENDDCLIKTKRWVLFEEIAYCGCKLSIFLYTPLALLISEYVELDNPSAFYNLLVVVSIQLVHNSKSLVNAISAHNKFTGSLEKLEKIIKEDNIRKDIYTGEFYTVKINNLEYSYKYNKDNDDKAGKTVTIKIPYFRADVGDKVCIYGESGQGKTTLLHLLSGEIENDNTTINEEITDKRLDCVFIAQDTEMFDMSLRDNLTLGRDISDDKLISYLETVGLGDWLSSQKDGLNTMLGERGVFVSTGQRQRLNLVRGLLIDDKDVYLLDEPTSNVDEETEEAMVKLINEVLHDKTIIVVTHRPRIKEICNAVYKFENGVIHFESLRR